MKKMFPFDYVIMVTSWHGEDCSWCVLCEITHHPYVDNTFRIASDVFRTERLLRQRYQPNSFILTTSQLSIDRLGIIPLVDSTIMTGDRTHLFGFTLAIDIFGLHHRVLTYGVWTKWLPYYRRHFKCFFFFMYRQFFNIRRTQSQNKNVSRLV